MGYWTESGLEIAPKVSINQPDGRIVTKIRERLPRRYGRGGNDLAIRCDEIRAGDIRGGLLIIEQERPGAARMMECVCAL